MYSKYYTTPAQLHFHLRREHREIPQPLPPKNLFSVVPFLFIFSQTLTQFTFTLDGPLTCYTHTHTLTHTPTHTHTHTPCRHMTELTLQPNEAETAWEARPRGLNKAAKDERREVLGLSSLTTTHVRTTDRSIPRD